jgi:hypothetical protein
MKNPVILSTTSSSAQELPKSLLSLPSSTSAQEQARTALNEAGQCDARFLLCLTFAGSDAPSQKIVAGIAVVQTEIAEILTRHHRRHLHHVLIAKRLLERTTSRSNQLRIVIRRSRSFRDFHDRRAIFRNARRLRDAFHDPLDRRQHTLPHFFLVRAHSQLQVHFIGMML